jgi:hypothetical protein
MKILLIAALATTLTHAHARASDGPHFYAFQTGQELLDMCNTNEFACLTYMEGIEDEIQALQFTKQGLWMCERGPNNGQQLRDWVLAKLKSDKDLLDINAAVAVTGALRDANPCK